MATVWATTAGNVSVGANWNTGAVPGIADDVYADGKDMVCDINFVVRSLNTMQRAGGTVGGSFSVLTGININAAFGFNFATATTSAGLILDIAAPNSSTILGDIVSNAGRGVSIKNSGTVNWIGSILDVSLGVGFNQGVVISTSSGIVNWTGFLRGGQYIGGLVNTYSWGYYHGGTGTLNVIGGAHGARALSNTGAMAIVGASTGPINLTGSCVSGTGTSSHGIYSATLCEVTINGILDTAVPPATIVAAVNIAGKLKFGGIIYNRGENLPFVVGKMVLLSTASTRWIFKDDGVGEKSLYSADYTPLGNPAASNVRSTITYGPANELMGSLIVCPKSSVAKNVPTDDGVGTMEMLPSDFWAYANRTLTAGNLTAQEVWEYVNRTITSGGITAAEIWGYLFTSVLPDDSFGKLFKDYLNAKVGDIPAAVIDELTSSMEDVAVRIRNLATAEIVGDIHAT